MRPVTLLGHRHSPDVMLQDKELENSEQLQTEHPLEVKLKKLGRQALQVLPSTPGRQAHWPESIHMGEGDPTESHWQAA